MKHTGINVKHNVFPDKVFWVCFGLMDIGLVVALVMVNNGLIK